jgi:prevent-host-death family protein
MRIVNIHEAKTHLSRVLERVVAGEDIIIAKNGQPIARLVPVGGAPRRPGRLQDKIHMGLDFDDPVPDEIGKPHRAD